MPRRLNPYVRQRMVFVKTDGKTVGKIVGVLNEEGFPTTAQAVRRWISAGRLVKSRKLAFSCLGLFLLFPLPGFHKSKSKTFVNFVVKFNFDDCAHSTEIKFFAAITFQNS